MKDADLIIIGAGPGGMSAASEAVSHGVSVLILDENSLPGGQYFRQIPKEFCVKEKTAFDKNAKDSSKAALLFSILKSPLVSYKPDTVVWGYFSGNKIAYTSESESNLSRAPYVIIATGAIDRVVPFPGWTLPGVITAGGAQNLLVSQHVLPGRRVLITGNGPLNFVVAYNLCKAGAKVLEILESSCLSTILKSLPDLFLEPSILLRGMYYRATLVRNGVLVKTEHTVVEARGDDQVREVVVAPIDSTGTIDQSRLRSIEVDTLIAGFGLMPETAITRLIGCDHTYDIINGVLVPLRNEGFETTISNVFAVGDCSGIRGVNLALLEGRLAGLTVSRRLGRISEMEASKVESPLRKKLARLERFYRAMDNLFTPPNTFLSLIKDDTIICRCEEITLGQLRKFLKRGITDMNRLKALTRIGMGRCQVRNCLSTFASLVAEELGCKPSELVLPRVRQPIKPVCLGQIVSGDIPAAEIPELKLA